MSWTEYDANTEWNMKLEEAIEIVMALATKRVMTAEERAALNVVHDFFVNNVFGDE